MREDVKDKINLPSFICIGAQRAGTTWLHHCLKEHPDIFMPEKKELRFFNYNYEEGIDEYSKNFTGANGYKAIGEITPDYYRQQYALLRIKEHVPDVKLIFILRNPIDRAYSQYQLYHGTEYAEMTFEETYLNHPAIVDWGRYGEHLEFIYRHFNRENVLVIEYELLKDDPEEFLRQIFGYLGVDESFRPDNLSKSYNKVIYPKTQKFLAALGLSFIVELVKNSWIGDRIRNRQSMTGISISEQDFEYLSNQFADDVKKLEQIMGKDYSGWLVR